MRDVTRWWLIGLGALMAAGSFLPWVQAGLFSAAGTSGDGVFTLIGGVIVAIVGLSKQASLVTAGGVVLVAGFSLWVVFNVTGNITGMLVDDSTFGAATYGTGLFVTGIASLLAIIAGVQLGNDSRKPPTLE
ncbi:MAG TPA: hypothetical protein VJA46_11355 [Acidimicrobiia bacterium]|nr:hypothetical protein [Acidimicrobiia bacterium]